MAGQITTAIITESNFIRRKLRCSDIHQITFYAAARQNNVRKYRFRFAWIFSTFIQRVKSKQVNYYYWIAMSEASNNLEKFLWDEQSAHDFFDQNLWPTFIGSKTTYDKDPELPKFPVAVWKEQASISTEAPTRNNKRKLEQVCVVSGAESTTEVPNKKPKISLLSYCYSLFSSFFSSKVMAVAPSSLSSMSAARSDNSTEGKSLPIEHSILVRSSSSAKCSVADITRSKVFQTLHSAGYFIGPGDIYGECLSK